MKKLLLLAAMLTSPGLAYAEVDDVKTGSTNPEIQSSETVSGSPSIFIAEQNLQEVLRLVAKRNNVQLNLTRKVRGTIRNTELPLEIRAFMEMLGKQFDLKWHFLNNQLFVSTSYDDASRMIFLGSMNFDELKSAMSSLGLEPETYEMAYIDDTNSVFVNAPASYIANIELIAESFNKNNSNTPTTVKVIRGGRVGN